MRQNKVTVVGIGGSTRAGSTAESALRAVLARAERLGAEVRLIAGPDLRLPLYDPKEAVRSPQASRLISEIAAADGLVLASPAYHGGMSGLVKNALDHVEELREDVRPYFTDRPVGCVAVGQGWQGAVATLAALRDTVFALRGWPTPLGVALNTAEAGFDPVSGRYSDERLQGQLEAMAGQVVEFARMRRAATLASSPAAALSTTPSSAAELDSRVPAGADAGRSS
ncbi:NAD(P)H-dependent oxidoreductase [Kitasatospora sp. NPDC093806]|uniref:NADPH-dependent FMN reductase n=1 Tax=Kitasatospora sp. NPDC093806 TaxID=3155075 RepID=UPI00343312AC